MLVGQQMQAGQKASAGINCPCYNKPGSPTRSVIINKTTKALERKLANLLTMKCLLALPNQVL